MLFTNWASLLFLGVASALPLISETDITDGPAINLARSTIGFSNNLLVARHESATTSLTGKKDKKYRHYVFNIVATNWDSTWFGGEHSKKKERVQAIYVAVKRYAKSQGRRDLMSEPGGAKYKKIKDLPNSVLYSIGCTGVTDIETATLMRGYIEHVLVEQTKIQVTMPNKKEEAAAAAAETELESS